MAERRFTVRLDAEMNIGQVKSAVQAIQTELSKLNLPQDVGSKLTGTFDKLTGEIERFQAMSAKGIGSRQEFNQLANSGNKILQLYEQLSNQVRGLGNLSDGQLQKLFPPQALSNIQKANTLMQQYTNSTKDSEKQIDKLEREIAQAEKATEKLRTQKEKLESKSIVSDTTFKQMEKDADKAEREFREAEQALKDLQKQAQGYEERAEQKQGSAAKARQSSTYRDIVDKSIPEQEKEVARLEQAWERLKNKRDKTLTQSKRDKALAQLVQDIQTAEGNIATLRDQLNNLKASDPQAFQQLITQLNQIKGISLDPTTATIEQVQQAVARLSQQEIEQLKNSFIQAGNTVNGTRGQFQGFQQQIDQTRTKVNQLDSAMGEVDMLKSRISYFFGLTNSVYLFRRAITSAFKTIKELDKTMTEAAVVTDFSVDDMWDKLPQYANEANKLGTSINSLYGATTLYYQQGLKTNEAMDLGIETMKMARIAGMESAEATEAMTAALRGFNMELNEASATRVNDVYSKLAAITASDTEQIATAMSKTASIANAANMEFETTAALLAQIIETTQEAPETAGTAMKTIIARFTEVKELFSQGQLTGEDSEGEEININKIDAALKTVGISLKDFLNGSKGVDDIFLELAEKWDDLDLATQRYIATMAAGSRQQSRFIAMMSDYDRTMELVNAANNSAGASQQQFNKTLESLDSKLEKLGVAWDTFLRGIANNEIIKDMIDLLTEVINIVNKITTLGGKSSDSFSIITKLGLTAIGLRGAKALLNKGITSLVSSFTSAGSEAGVGFFQGFGQSLAFRGNRAEIFGKDLSLAFDRVQYADVNGNGRLLVQQNMQALGNQYHLTSAQVDELTNSMANGNSATQTSNAFLAKNQVMLKQQRAQMLKNTLTIAAIVAAIAIILSQVEKYKEAVDNAYETTEEKLQTLNRLESDLTESTNKLSESMENLGNTKTEFKGLIKELEKVKQGTSAWAQKMHEVRTQMLDIFETYPELRQFTETVNGITVLTDRGWVEYELAMLETYYSQMQSLYGVKMSKNETEQVQRAEQLNLQTNTVNAKEEQDIQQGKTYGGYIGGATLAIGGYIGGTALGAKIGGAIGTTLGPIGTVVGAALGVAIGALIGGLVNGSKSATEGISPDNLNQVAEHAILYQNGKKTGFSAQEAMQSDEFESEIIDFLTDSGLEEGTEDFQTMLNYIKGNAKEFDEHTSYLAQANAELLLFGKNLGYINAEKKGYTGEQRDTYAAISAAITAEHWDMFVDREYKELTRGITSSISETDFTLNGQSKLIAEFQKAYQTGYEWRDGIVYYEGTEDQVSDKQFLNLLASYRAQDTSEVIVSDLFNLASQSSGVSDFINWFYGDNDALAENKDTTGLGVTDMAGLLSTGYAGLEQVNKLGNYDDFLWKVYQNTAGPDSKSPVGYEYYTNSGAFGSYTNPTTSYHGLQSYAQNFYSEGKTQTYWVDPKDFGNFKEYAEAVDSYEYLNNAMGFDFAAALTHGVTADIVTWATDEIFGGPAIGWENFADDSRADDIDIPGVKEWAINNGYADIGALGWTLFFGEGDQDSAGLERDLAALNQQYNEFQSWIKNTGETYTGFDAQGNQIVKTVENGYGFDFLSGIDYNNAKAFIEQFNIIQKTYDLEGKLPDGKAFGSYFEDFANSFGENTELMNKAMNIVAQSDFDNLTELRDVQQQLKELGISEESQKIFDGFVEDLKEVGFAVSDIDLETLQAQLQDTNKIIKKLNDLTIGDNLYFTKEEYQTLLNNGFTTDQFYSTSEGFVYLEDSLNSLRDTLIQVNTTLMGLQIDALRGKTKTANAIEAAGLEDYAWGATGTLSDTNISSIIQGLLGMEATEIENMDLDVLRQKMSGTILDGLDVENIKHLGGGGKFSELSESAQAGFSAVFSEWGDAWVNRASYETQLESGIESTKQQTLSLMTGQELINLEGTSVSGVEGETYTKEDIDEALRVQAQLQGTTISGYEMGQQINQQVGQQAYDAAITNGVAPDDAAIARQEAMNKAYEESHRLGQALALDAAKNRTEFKNLTSIFNNYTSTITKANRGSEEYKKGLSKIQEALKDVYGINISEQFMLDHAEVLERVLAGEEGAWEEYTQLLIEDTAKSVESLEGVGKAVLNLDNIASTISPVVGVTTTYNDAGIVAAQLGLQALGGQAVTTEEQMASLKALYELMGATITFTTDTQYYDGTNWSKTPLPNGTAYTVITGVNVTNTGRNVYRPSGGGGGGGSKQEWENPYDEFYNTTERLNEQLREREKLERRYQRLLDQTNAKSENLVANLKEQLDSLKQEKDIREELLKNRERQMNDIETEYSDMRQYGYYDEKTQQIVIDWSKIEALDGSENEELTSRIEEYIGKLEEQQDLIEEEQDALEDINDAIWEIYQQGKDAYLSMENKIKEAIIADRQKEIDKLSDINDSINDTNSRLIDAMQSSVDKYRQDRDNEKTEEELSDKRRRLAYLRQDTSGANALEIMQLQEELDEATEDYTDTLIDQKISELQEQNDKAAEQRQRQIELMQAQLDYYGESMLIWEEVNDLLVNGYNISKGLLQGSRLEELLRSAEGFEGMSQIEQMNWMKDTNKELAEGFGWLKSGALQYLYGRGATIEFKNKDGNIVSGVINDDGDVEVKDTQGNVTGVYSGESFAIDANKNITSSETMTQASGRVTKPQPVEPSTPEIVDASGNISSLPGSTYLTNDQVKKLQRGLNELLADGKLSGFAKLQVDGIYGGLTAMAVGKLQAAIGTPVDGKWGPNTKRAFDSSHLKAYKTGGLADFTGPAWLDGTKSRPEYILNAEQTKSFFQLVDVLSGLSNDSAQSSQITGDSIYDIDINVESVNNDYDVEQMAETIKRLINDDARYRNNNTINLQR